MVRFLKRGNSLDRFLKLRHMFDHSARRAHSQPYDSSNDVIDENILVSQQLEVQQMATVLEINDEPEQTKEEILLDMALMKEKFAKLLLCEDMSGSGRKGVTPALTLSNAITNLAASVFGEQRRLEPMPLERKARWKKEIDWLLTVADQIVVLVPTKQVHTNGTVMEVMRNQQRHDLHMGIPALRKIDAMLIQYLDTFKDSPEFWYISKDSDEFKNNSTQREDDKWWLPTVKVQPGGLSYDSRRHIVTIRGDTNQILKLAMAINANVLTEMQIPDAYIENLPKNGKESLGDSLYKSITDDFFNPIDFISSMDLSTEHKIRDLKDRIEASVVIWKRKMNNKDSKSPWGISSGVSLEKREQFEERAETILQILKHKFPGTAQSSLDTSKIEHNKDVGFAILESYSRVLESVASTVLARIEDVIRADDLVKSVDCKKHPPSHDSEPEVLKLTRKESSPLTTLSDFMEWNAEQDSETRNSGNLAETLQPVEKMLKKPAENTVPKKFSYLESLGGLRSPTISRH